MEFADETKQLSVSFSKFAEIEMYFLLSYSL